MDPSTAQPHIPSEAYLYFPKKHELKCTQGQRAVFDGNTVFNEDEIQMLAKLNAYAEKQNYIFKPIWTDGMKLRFLYANNFKMPKTLESIQEHTTWRETCLPVKIDEPLQRFLNSGLLYVHGRDSQFRPIVIFNVSMIDPKRTDTDLVIRAMTFWLEYVIQEWMLPGQIENWVFIANLKGVGAATLALQSMRKLFAYLSDNFKCRLQTLYFLNVASSMYIPWQIIKKFLDDVTVQKIQFYKTQIPTTLFDTTNREQVEQKYGGTAPNATQFWPPIIPSTNYFVSPDNSKALISKEEYTALYRQGTLTHNMRLDHSLLVDRNNHRNFTVGTLHDQGIQSARLDRCKTTIFNEEPVTTRNSSDPFHYDPATTRNYPNERLSFEPATARSHPSDHFMLKSFDPQALATHKLGSDSDSMDINEDTDYVNYMDESPESDKARSAVKHFEAAFITKVRHHWHSQSVKY